MSRKTDMRIDVERFLAMTAMMAAPLLGACGQEAEAPERGSCAGGKCDDGNPADFACQNVRDEVNGGTLDLTGNNDPLANLVLKADGGACPTTYAETLQALAAAEPDCATESSLGPIARVGTIVVSETAALLGMPEDGMFGGSYSYRTVTRSTCDGKRQDFELLFAQFGVQPGAGAPRNTEVIAMGTVTDAEGVERSVFNYYDLSNGQWEFHGSSLDFIEGRGGRCKSCHTSGGLIMKEFASPWVHWDFSGDPENDVFSLPGAELIGEEELFGSVDGDGLMMEEFITAPGNDVWQDTRVRHLLAKNDLKGLLSPMFCPTEVNLGTGGFGFFPAAALVDSASTGFADGVAGPFGTSGFEVDEDAYGRSIEGQFMTDNGGGPLRRGDGSMLSRNDTDFAMAFPQRSWSDLDMLEKLKEAGVIDEQLQSAIAGVDFTRPIFSSDRCGLLDLVTDVGPLLGGPSEPEPPGPVDGQIDDSIEAGNCCETRGNDFDPTVEFDPTNEFDPTDEGAGRGPQSAGEPGCTNEAIQTCVCEQDSFCCTNTWDSACIQLVNSDACLEALDANGRICDVEPEFDEFPDTAFGEDLNITQGLPDAIRDMLRSRLEQLDPSPSSPEGQLLANLDRPLEEIQADVGRFVNACDTMDDDDFLAGYMVVLGKRRRDTMRLPQYEFAATFPQDDFDMSGDPHLDPETCELRR